MIPLKWTYQVPNQIRLERIDRFLFKLIPNAPEGWENDESIELSRSRIQNLIEEQQILLNNKPVKGKTVPQAGDQIQVLVPPPIPLEVIPQNIDIEILYEDTDLAIVVKPKGLTVHPNDHQKTETLVNALLYQIKDLSGVGGVLRPGIVHRLDKDTSGVMVISKTDRSHHGLSEMFKTHDLTRKYWALVYGDPKFTEETTFTHLLNRNPKDRKKMAVVKKEGKTAISHFKVIKRFAKPGKKPFASLVEARLETGRTHQVRVQLTHLGHSLLGDPIYGTPTHSQAKWKELPQTVQQKLSEFSGQALHARHLSFSHPITREKLSFDTSPPKDFTELLELLKKYE